jgi:hypothetical protein
MELTLNLVWLGVAIAAVLVQIAMFSRARGSALQPANYGRKVIAMGCALVILFFVISMTDDLHDQQVMIEERKVLRITAGTETAANPDSAKPLPIHLLLFFSSLAFSPNTLAVRRGIETSEILPVVGTECEHLYGRAPPPSLV